MPGFDGTGPLGQGSLTGRGMGYCAGGPYPYAREVYGVGRGGIPWGGGRGRAWGGGRGRFGRGRSFGWPGWGYPTLAPNPADEKAWLEAAMKDLQTELEGIKKRIEEIGQEKG